MTVKANGTFAGRVAFTLVETLVVIAVIGVLLSIAAGGYMLVLRTQKQKNTDALIGKVTDALTQQRRAVEDAVKRATFRREIPIYYLDKAGGDRTNAIFLWLHQGGDPSNGAAWGAVTSWAAIIQRANDTSTNPPPSASDQALRNWKTWVQTTQNTFNGAMGEPPLLMQEFPMNYDMAWIQPNCQGLLKAAGYAAAPPAIPDVQPGSLPVPTTPPPQWETPPWPTSESSASLLVSLSIARGTGAFRIDDLEPGAAVDLPDLDKQFRVYRAADRIKELRDAWNDPLRFEWRFNATTKQLEPVLTSSNPR